MKSARIISCFASIVVILSFAFAYRISATELQQFGADFAQLKFHGQWQPYAKDPIFLNQPVATRPQQLAYDSAKNVLSQMTPEDNKWIEIDLSDQRLYAWEGGQLVYNFLISSGKWGLTPTGDFRIWVKMRYCLMAGGNQALGTYYYLPNVPFTMYFYRDYGLHGTYWHNNFGHPMSHGCVNMKTEEAEQLFWWAGPNMYGQSIMYPTPDNPGTRVVIHE